jgi:hypothetical protein
VYDLPQLHRDNGFWTGALSPLRRNPSLSNHYRSKIRNLSSTLQDPGLKMEAAEALHGLIREIRMVPDAEAPSGHHIELAGELSGILALGEAQTTKPAPCLASQGQL